MTQRAWLRTIGLASLGFFAVACNTNDMTGAGVASDLDISATGSPDVVITNAGVRRSTTTMDVAQTVGGVQHRVSVTWDSVSHAVTSVTHHTSVDANILPESCGPCPSEAIVLDVDGGTITFANLELDSDPYEQPPQLHATLNGTIAWNHN